MPESSPSTVTRADIAALNEGDLIELRHPRHLDFLLRGRVSFAPGSVEGDQSRMVAGRSLSFPDGDLTGTSIGHTLTVVEKAPKAFYVNHPRTEPVSGDVARAAWTATTTPKLLYRLGSLWYDGDDKFVSPTDLPTKLRLLIDGKLGAVVAS